jgi:apolipoprotein D and lipocalin family protein
MPTVEHVELDRFMGDWYVIANIPTFLEQGAHNAVERYRLAENGTIETTFMFRKGGFDGPERVYRPRGFVKPNTGNAHWGMRFIWPIRADYRIVYLDEAYQQTIIGRQRRDFVWIMARTPSIPESDLDALLGFVGDLGYDITRVERVPQQADTRE